MKTNGAFIYVKMKNGAHIYNLFEDSFFFHKIKKILLQIGGGGGGIFIFFFFNSIYGIKHIFFILQKKFLEKRFIIFLQIRAS